MSDETFNQKNISTDNYVLLNVYIAGWNIVHLSTYHQSKESGTPLYYHEITIVIHYFKAKRKSLNVEVDRFNFLRIFSGSHINQKWVDVT